MWAGRQPDGAEGTVAPWQSHGEGVCGANALAAAVGASRGVARAGVGAVSRRGERSFGASLHLPKLPYNDPSKLAFLFNPTFIFQAVDSTILLWYKLDIEIEVQYLISKRL